MRKLFLFFTMPLLTFVTSCTVDKAAENLAFHKAYESTSPYEVNKFLREYPKADVSRLDSIKERLDFVTKDSVLYARIMAEKDVRKRYELSGKYVEDFATGGIHYEDVWELYNNDIVTITEMEAYESLYTDHMKDVYYCQTNYRHEHIVFSKPDENRKGICKMTYNLLHGFYTLEFKHIFCGTVNLYKEFLDISITNEEMEKDPFFKITATYEFDYEIVDTQKIRMTYKRAYFSDDAPENATPDKIKYQLPKTFDAKFFENKFVIYVGANRYIFNKWYN